MKEENRNENINKNNIKEENNKENIIENNNSGMNIYLICPKAKYP